MASPSQRTQHLFSRAGYGLPASYFGREGRLRLKKERKNLLKKGTKERGLRVFEENPFLHYRQLLTQGDTDPKTVREGYSKTVREGRREFRSMSMAWMEQMTDPALVVREKLTFFWHDHFGVRVTNAYQAQLHNNLLRKYALGKYGDLLKAVAKDAAMMNFLNTQQNVRRKPNENFARELFELYTLGRGHYTEEDVQSAARAFTGWKHDRFSFDFNFVPRLHDPSEKTVLGKKGNFGGDEVIDLLLSNRQTANYLATKLFQYYVSDEPDVEIISLMAEKLYNSEYDIGQLLEFIFSSDWFYEDRFINSKIKSPVELINGLRVHLGLKYERPEALVFLQNSFDQKLFFPPSVNGWPVGREWINSASLVHRMRLAQVLVNKADVGIRFKEELDNSGSIQGLGVNLLETGTTNLQVFEENLSGNDLRKCMESLLSYLTNQDSVSKDTERMLVLKANQSAKPIQSLIVSIAGLPEYQLA